MVGLARWKSRILRILIARVSANLQWPQNLGLVHLFRESF